MASAYLETIRVPLAQARVELDLAEADLNAIVARLSAGETVSHSVAHRANARVIHARHELDRVRFASMGLWALNGRDLRTNDPGDMTEALTVALERAEHRPAPINTGMPAVVSAHA